MQNTNAGSLSSLQIKVSPLELADDISPYYFHRFMFANMHQNENCFAKLTKQKTCDSISSWMYSCLILNFSYL